MRNFYDDRNDTGNVQVDYTALNNGDNGGYEEKPKPLKKWTAFKIVLAVLYALVTIFCVWTFIDACGNTGSGRGLGLAIVITLIIGTYGVIGYGLVSLMSLIGVIMSAIAYKKKECKVGTLVYFIVFMLLPIATYYGMMLIFPLLI